MDGPWQIFTEGGRRYRHRALEVQLLFLDRLFGAYLDHAKIFLTYVQRNPPEMKQSVDAPALLSHERYQSRREVCTTSMVKIEPQIENANGIRS